MTTDNAIIHDQVIEQKMISLIISVAIRKMALYYTDADKSN